MALLEDLASVVQCSIIKYVVDRKGDNVWMSIQPVGFQLSMIIHIGYGHILVKCVSVNLLSLVLLVNNDGMD